MAASNEIYTLTITGVTIKMTGNYRCVAKNKFGVATHTAKITISDGKTPAKKPEEKKPEEKKPGPKTEVVEEEIMVVIEEKAETAPSPAPKPEDTGAPKFVEVYEAQTLIIKKTLTLKARITGKPAPMVEWFR